MSAVALSLFDKPRTGDLLRYDGKAWRRLPVGSNGQVLTVVGGKVVWKTQELATVGGDGLGTDGDKGDVSVGESGTTLTIGTGAVTTAKMGGDVTTAGKAMLTAADAAAQAALLPIAVPSGALADLDTVNDAQWSGTDLAVANGGTGASDAATARTNLGLAIGSDVQAFDAQLTALAGLAYAGNALKGIRVNAGETGFELAAITASDPSGYTAIVKSANQDVTNLGLTNDTEFVFAVVAGGHYAIDADLYVSGNNTTGDFTMDFQVSAGTQRGKGTVQNLTAAGAVQNIILTAAGVAATTAVVTGAPSADLDDLVAVNVHYAFTASATGNMQFRFGNSAAASGRTSRVWKGSVLRYKRLD